MKAILLALALLFVVGCGKIPQSEYRYFDMKEQR